MKNQNAEALDARNRIIVIAIVISILVEVLSYSNHLVAKVSNIISEKTAQVRKSEKHLTKQKR